MECEGSRRQRRNQRQGGKYKGKECTEAVGTVYFRRPCEAAGDDAVDLGLLGRAGEPAGVRLASESAIDGLEMELRLDTGAEANALGDAMGTSSSPVIADHIVEWTGMDGGAASTAASSVLARRFFDGLGGAATDAAEAIGARSSRVASKNDPGSVADTLLESRPCLAVVAPADCDRCSAPEAAACEAPAPA